MLGKWGKKRCYNKGTEIMKKTYLKTCDLDLGHFSRKYNLNVQARGHLIPYFTQFRTLLKHAQLVEG